MGCEGCAGSDGFVVGDVTGDGVGIDDGSNGDGVCMLDDVGAAEGDRDGCRDGICEGALEGTFEGDRDGVGKREGDNVGAVGDTLGFLDGDVVGVVEGIFVGRSVGAVVGREVGSVGGAVVLANGAVLASMASHSALLEPGRRHSKLRVADVVVTLTL